MWLLLAAGGQRRAGERDSVRTTTFENLPKCSYCPWDSLSCYWCWCWEEYALCPYLAPEFNSHVLKLASIFEGDWLTPPSNISMGLLRTRSLKLCHRATIKKRIKNGESKLIVFYSFKALWNHSFKEKRKNLPISSVAIISPAWALK